MNSVRTFPHHDVVRYVQDEEPPHALKCAISHNLIVQGARINGDTTDSVYEASVLRRALELKQENPITRAPVTRVPAIIPDVTAQKDATMFRAQVLGYIKVATWFADRGENLPDGRAPVLPPGLRGREAVAHRYGLNLLAKQLAKRPIRQPPPPQAPLAPAGPFPLNDLANMRLQRALDMGQRAWESIPNTQAAALSASRAALGARSMSQLSHSLRETPEPYHARRRANAMGRIAYSDAFGDAIANAARDVVECPSLFGMHHLFNLAYAAGVALGDILLFNRGEVLNAVVDDGAWHTLLPFMSHLTQSARRVSLDGGLGLGFLDTAVSQLYVGELQNHRPQGHGLAMDLQSQSYAVGHWRDGSLQGLARYHDAASETVLSGRFEHYRLREGERRSPHDIQRGRFSEHGLCDLGERTTPVLRARGIWRNGGLTTGEVVFLQTGETATITRSTHSSDHFLGTIGYATGPIYYGAIRDCRPNGYGVLALADGSGLAGLWREGTISGPSATLRPEGISLNVNLPLQPPETLLERLAAGQNVFI